jgi:hypothetical protein
VGGPHAQGAGNWKSGKAAEPIAKEELDNGSAVLWEDVQKRFRAHGWGREGRSAQDLPFRLPPNGGEIEEAGEFGPLNWSTPVCPVLGSRTPIPSLRVGARRGARGGDRFAQPEGKGGGRGPAPLGSGPTTRPETGG